MHKLKLNKNCRKLPFLLPQPAINFLQIVLIVHMEGSEDETISSNGNPDENSNSNANSAVKPSPIIITDPNSSITSISSSLNSLNIQLFSIKKLSIGLKVFLSKSSDFINYVQHIKDHKIEFYTHRNRSERVFKVVLSGLDKCDISTIQSGLDVYHLHPNFEMKTKNSNSSRALYLCHFKSSEVTLRDFIA